MIRTSIRLIALIIGRFIIKAVEQSLTTFIGKQLPPPLPISPSYPPLPLPPLCPLPLPPPLHKTESYEVESYLRESQS